MQSLALIEQHSKLKRRQVTPLLGGMKLTSMQTMKNQITLVVMMLVVLFITACRNQNTVPRSNLILPTATNFHTPTTPPSLATTATPHPTQTQAPKLTNTGLPRPTKTPAASATIVPTGTSYPTFDLSQVITNTPAPPVECPPENSELQLSIAVSRETNPNAYMAIIQQAFDEGASLNQVAEAFEQALTVPDFLPVMDLTGDHTPELIVPELFGVSFIGCAAGEYKTLLEYSTALAGGDTPTIFSVQDMNLNGTPDVVLAYQATTGGNTVVDIIEWDGLQFVSSIQSNHGESSPQTSLLAQTLYWYADNNFTWSNTPGMNGRADLAIRDLDGNGTAELILSDNGPGHWDTLYNFGPWRGKRVVFEWDGSHYLYALLEIAPPAYRFQALQDADRFFLLDQYDLALQLYQDVIFSNMLEWWSPERMQYLRDVHFAEANERPTPIAPSPNLEEYASLAAYARYRIMLQYVTRGWLEEAEVVYNSLQDEFPVGTVGYPYAELAALFWAKYQEALNIEAACDHVIEFVALHPEMLDPLGDKKHGLQSHVYMSEDICPYK